MNIAVTGATGFIGKYTVKHLLNEGHKVTALGRDIHSLNENFNSDISKQETDYSYESILNVLEGVDAIVHLAAKRLQKDLDPLDIEPYVEGNIILTQRLLKAAHQLEIDRFCQASSISVYSTLNSLPFAETEVPSALSIYGVSKLACENLANLYGAKTKMKVTNLRLTSLCGVGERAGVICADYFNLAKEKKTLEIWGEGKTSIDFIYVKDAARAIEKALSMEHLPGTYNVGSGRCYSIKELAETVNSVFGNEGNIKYHLEKKEGGYKLYMDSAKAEKELGWKPKWSLSEAFFDMKNICGL